MAVDVGNLKAIACRAIDEAADDLIRLSKDIWEHPELNFEEHYAHGRLATYLEEKDFLVERKFILETGFRSVVSGGRGPNVALLCEYDALPEIGHACGHNLIAEVGVGASLGVKAALDVAKQGGKNLGTLTVLGTPAEEGGCGKVRMIAAGVFKDIDAAMMAHPVGDGMGEICTDVAFTALQPIKIRYYGKASHAAGFPWEGVNALDAAVMAYSSISCMRQQMKPTWRIHGIISNGGAKPNIIPEETAMEYYIRTPSVKELNSLKDMADKCFRAAATATGCRVEIEYEEFSADNVLTNQTIAGIYDVNARALGGNPVRDPSGKSGFCASTDMGNVTQVVPGIHPCFAIHTNSVNHSREFAAAAVDPKAQAPTLLQAKALAMTVIDLYCTEGVIQKAKDELKESLA